MSGTKTPGRCAGVVAAACTHGKRTQHGKPPGVVSDDQPDAREGQAGRLGVAEPPHLYTKVASTARRIFDHQCKKTFATISVPIGDIPIAARFSHFTGATA